MKRLRYLIQVLRRGEELSHGETWKRAGVATAALTGLLSALAGFAVTFGWIPEGVVTEEQIMQGSSAVVTLVGLALAYLQTATTPRIGLPPTVRPPTDTDRLRETLREVASPEQVERFLSEVLTTAAASVPSRALADTQPLPNLPPSYRPTTRPSATDDPRGLFTPD